MADRGVGFIFDDLTPSVVATNYVNRAPARYHGAGVFLDLTAVPGPGSTVLEPTLSTGPAGGTGLVVSEAWDGTKWINLQLTGRTWDGAEWWPLANALAWDGTEWWPMGGV